jgi:hypothetical protein
LAAIVCQVIRSGMKGRGTAAANALNYNIFPCLGICAILLRRGAVLVGHGWKEESG